MTIDILFLILMAMAAFKGYSRGLIVAVFSLLAVIIALAAALKLSSFVAGKLMDTINITTQWVPFISFAIVFIGFVFLIRMAANMLEKMVSFAMLGWVNKLGGILLYATAYTMVLSVVLFFSAKIQLIQSATIEASITYPFIAPFGPKVIDGIGYVIPLLKNIFEELSAFFEKVARVIV